jgi:arsenate reductase
MSPIRVLFLCTGNSARSAIAEALLKDMGGGDFDVYSAGTHPKGINPYTIRVLQAEHVDASELRSKDVSEFSDQTFDFVITVCDSAAEECPIFPGTSQRIHWSFEDPAAVDGPDLVKLAAFQETLRGMKQQIAQFIPVALRAAAKPQG